LHTASNMNKSTLRHSQCFQCREQNQPTVSVYASQQCLWKQKRENSSNITEHLQNAVKTCQKRAKEGSVLASAPIVSQTKDKRPCCPIIPLLPLWLPLSLPLLSSQCQFLQDGFSYEPHLSLSVASHVLSLARFSNVFGVATSSQKTSSTSSSQLSWKKGSKIILTCSWELSHLSLWQQNYQAFFSYCFIQPRHKIY